MTLYTGFTADPRLALVHPKYKQDYTWEKHRKVYINSAGCLRPCECCFFFFFFLNGVSPPSPRFPLPPLTNFKSQALPPPFPPKSDISTKKTDLYSDGHDWGIPEALGPCPPTLYSQHEPNIMNPYRKRDWDRRRMLGPALDGIHDFLIKPLLQEQPIIYPDNPDAAGTDPNLGYDFKPFAVPDELTTAEPPAYSSPAPVGQF